MKTIFKLFFCLLSLASTTAVAQNREAGQAVVPIGYEGQDTALFMLFGIQDIANYKYDPSPGWGYADSVADSVYATFEGSWGGLAPTIAYSGMRRGVRFSTPINIPRFLDFPVFI